MYTFAWQEEEKTKIFLLDSVVKPFCLRANEQSVQCFGQTLIARKASRFTCLKKVIN